MECSCKTAVLAGVAGGYFLGRTKKGKLALALASVLVGRRLGLGPQELLKKVTELPQFADLTEQVREELMTALRTAATSIVNRRIDNLSNALHERTENLGAAKDKDQPEEGGEESRGPGTGEPGDGEEKKTGKGEPGAGRTGEEESSERTGPRAGRHEQARSAGPGRR
ncbi:hypothetical protein GCM10018793_49730 [Streptomyces sulfonofaciens]|uniref:Uncharacterized protein n=1 Tax=Streptomyces sulfonofaciens TaxID=68272 RepID=A0A919L5K1_9ACTN|nr:hypothetical protein [Streptomyces sulfonofaciens]GHH84672.1 hypothetical protein GCM10018793_49730 [Streptomyces sulfonofaciens]